MKYLSSVFLSGPVTGLTYRAASDWRRYVSLCLPPHVQAVVPLRAQKYLNDGQTLQSGRQTFPFSTDRAITRRAHFDALRCTAVLVNLLGATTVSIGSMMEVAWASDHNIPVVAAIEPDGNIHDHAMLRDSLSVRVASLNEAIEAVIALIVPEENLICDRIEQNRLLMEENLLDLSPEMLKENGIRPQ